MSSHVKEEAAHLIENLPEDATWDDLMYEIYVRHQIEAGIAAADAGRTFSTEEVRRRLQLDGR
jgi:predicted transcriptional regulator